MRVVFIYVSCGGSSQDSVPAWNPKARAINDYIQGMASEGIFWMLSEMKLAGVIDDLLLIIESANNTGRFTTEGILGFVVPHISCVEPLLKKDDVLFVRGGFRGWHDWLESRKGKNWLLLYAANTGREKWKWWDVVLHDLSDLKENYLDRNGRFWLKFKKPVHPEVFRPVNSNQVYDFCIGASYIHDRKGQWRTIKVLEEYRKLYRKVPKCIMPGAPRRGTYTNESLEKAKELGVVAPGHIFRQNLNLILNSSKFFVHLGYSGQNDRGPLEALRCGCKLIIGSPERHACYVSSNPLITFVPEDINNYRRIARHFHYLLSKFSIEDKWLVSQWYEQNSGYEVIIDDMKKLFLSLKENICGSFRGHL